MVFVVHNVRKERIPVRGLKLDSFGVWLVPDIAIVRKERIPVRGLKLGAPTLTAAIRLKCVRKERIPVRGLKRKERPRPRLMRFGSQKGTNPREGIETQPLIPLHCFRRIFGQKGTNPREGIETKRWWITPKSSPNVRKERIPVRGLKPRIRRARP